jgi:hypothetical protein
MSFLCCCIYASSIERIVTCSCYQGHPWRCSAARCPAWTVCWPCATVLLLFLTPPFPYCLLSVPCTHRALSTSLPFFSSLVGIVVRPLPSSYPHHFPTTHTHTHNISNTHNFISTHTHTHTPPPHDVQASSTYLVCAYTLPCWFALCLLRGRIRFTEAALCRCLIVVSILLSAGGLYSSVSALVQDIRSGGSGFGPPAR